MKETMSFTKTLLLGRWFVVFASILVMSMSGTVYMFGLYSNNIKTSLGYDQTTLNWLSFFKDLGASVGILSGLINEITPPWVVIFIGGIMNFFGYFMVWLAVTRRISMPKVWQMCIYMHSSANAQAFSNTGALVTCVKNFPESRGGVIGLLKGYTGLSGAIMTQIYLGLYGDRDSKSSLIFLLSWFPAAVCFVFLPVIRNMDNRKFRKENDLKVFYKFFYVSLGLAGFLIVLIITQKKFDFNRIQYVVSACIVAIFLILPLLVVVKEEYKVRENKQPTTSDINPSLANAENLTVSTLSVDISNPDEKQVDSSTMDNRSNHKFEFKDCAGKILKPPERGEDYNILQALFSVDMFIIFLASICGVGGTLTAIDNLGQIGNSLGYPTQSISTFVSLVSIWNYLGRTVAGFSSEFLLTKFKIPRPLLFTMTLFVSCIGHLLIAFGVPNSLYIATVIIGFCFGAQWPLIFAMISEIFGLKYYSTLYNFGSMASPIGLYVLNVRVAGNLYDKEALKQLESLGVKRKIGEELRCHGVECYKMAFLIITGITLFGSLVSFILVLRTRKFYQGDIYKKFREESRG